MRKPFLNYVFCAALGLAAFIATCALIHSLLPPRVPKGVAAKLEFFAQHKDEFDTLLVGTSAIYYVVSPEIFDQTTAENGLPTRTFNFGIDAMHPPENFYVLDQILKTKPRKLKWVFLEVADIQTRLFQVLGTERAVYWHDWRRTWLASRKAFNPRGNATWSMAISRLWLARRDLATHLKVFAQRSANVGRAVDLFSSRNRDRSAEADVELGLRRDGYRLAGQAMSPENAASFQKRLAQEMADARPKQLDLYADETYREYARRIRALGATPLFLVPPLISQSPLNFREPPPAPAPLLRYNDAASYPMLFQTQVRIDDSHLTIEGAEEFTRLLAREFVRRVREP